MDRDDLDSLRQIALHAFDRAVDRYVENERQVREQVTHGRLVPVVWSRPLGVFVDEETLKIKDDFDGQVTRLQRDIEQRGVDSYLTDRAIRET